MPPYVVALIKMARRNAQREKRKTKRARFERSSKERYFVSRIRFVFKKLSFCAM